MHQDIQFKQEANEFDKWIRRAIGGSPNLEILRLESADEDPGPNMPGARVAHDALVEHLIRKHAERLRILDFGCVFVSNQGLRSLFSSCKMLEEVHLWVGADAMVSINSI